MQNISGKSKSLFPRTFACSFTLDSRAIVFTIALEFVFWASRLCHFLTYFRWRQWLVFNTKIHRIIIAPQCRREGSTNLMVSIQNWPSGRNHAPTATSVGFPANRTSGTSGAELRADFHALFDNFVSVHRHLIKLIISGAGNLVSGRGRQHVVRDETSQMFSGEPPPNVLVDKRARKQLTMKEIQWTQSTTFENRRRKGWESVQKVRRECLETYFKSSMFFVIQWEIVASLKTTKHNFSDGQKHK